MLLPLPHPGGYTDTFDRLSFLQAFLKLYCKSAYSILYSFHARVYGTFQHKFSLDRPVSLI